MNSKQAKRLRRQINRQLSQFLGEGVRDGEPADITVKDRTYVRGLVDSQRFNTTVTSADGVTEVHKDRALQVRLASESPRSIYKRVKARVALQSKQPTLTRGASANVQGNRKSKQGRVLRSIRVRPEETTGAVEHTGAESLQPGHVSVPIL